MSSAGVDLPRGIERVSLPAGDTVLCIHCRRAWNADRVADPRNLAFLTDHVLDHVHRGAPAQRMTDDNDIPF